MAVQIQALITAQRQFQRELTQVTCCDATADAQHAACVRACARACVCVCVCLCVCLCACVHAYAREYPHVYVLVVSARAAHVLHAFYGMRACRIRRRLRGYRATTRSSSRCDWYRAA